MKNTIRSLLTAALTLSMACAGLADIPSKSHAQKAAKKPLVQIALLLDTSNSMDGLISQAKTQLWRIVNEFIKAKQDGVAPEVQVALYEYGKQSLAQAEGYIRRIQPLTTDLDKLSEELFALTTNGGDEYCGWVIKNAVAELEWSKDPKVYRAVFICGNEPFTQGPVDYKDSCKAAIAKGIVVNTIHCGSEGEGISGKWQDGALLADGRFLIIDQNRTVAHIEAPQDKEISRLNTQINTTYVAYGVTGGSAALRQAAQDRNALAAAPEVAAQRALTKASANYQNAGWDLVDASKNKDFKFETLKPEDLPADMKKMSKEEQKAFVDGKAKERAEIQAKIQSLNSEREKYIATQMKQNAANNTLDAAVISTVRDQAKKRDFQFQ